MPSQQRRRGPLVRNPLGRNPLGLFILVDRKPVACPDPFKWALNHGDTDCRRVNETVIGETRISTVFIGIDHAWLGGPPMLFETMCFGGPLDMEQVRTSTWELAESQHEAICTRVRGFSVPPQLKGGSE